MPTRPVRGLVFAALVSVLAFALSASVRAQRTEIVNKYPDGEVRERYEIDAEGRKDGTYELLRRDGSVMVRKRFKAGKLDGKFEELDRAGDPTVVMHFKDDVLHGRLEEYGRKGKPILVEVYRDGELDGRREVFDEDGERIEIKTYRGGELDGKFEVRRDDGLVKSGEYEDGVLDGVVKITRGREVVSKQVWDKGTLRILDGLEPFPVAKDALVTELQGIFALEVPDPPQGVDDPLWPRRIACLRILQAYRALCRVPWQEMSLKPEWNELCDAGAELCRVIGHLDHTPPQPAGMDDEAYRRGYEGTSHSNLHRGGRMETSVDGYMDDSDPSNIDRVGHRRWCLNPAMGQTGFGEAPGFSAMWSMDGSGGSARGLDAVMYPPPGWVPADFFDGHIAWSIAPLKGGSPKLDGLEIDIRSLDEDWVPGDMPLELDHVGLAPGGFGTGACLIFRPVGLSNRPGAKYLCTIREKGEAQPSWRYVVAFCDPIRDGMVR
jgi:antitoxin component YwqK of YwqJK toxin-antitoxin module